MVAHATSEVRWVPRDWEWDAFAMRAQKAPTSGPRNTQHAKKSSPQAHPAHKQRSPMCQVERCNADLSTLKEYHMRYKICEMHLKTNYIIRDGEQQRFCQQCGRFHLLTCFDSVKRSCRDRLSRHNARRRKNADDAHSGGQDADASDRPEGHTNHSGSTGGGSRGGNNKRRRAAGQRGVDKKGKSQQSASEEGSSNAACDSEPLQRGNSTQSEMPPLAQGPLATFEAPGGAGYSTGDWNVTDSQLLQPASSHGLQAQHQHLHQHSHHHAAGGAFRAAAFEPAVGGFKTDPFAEPFFTDAQAILADAQAMVLERAQLQPQLQLQPQQQRLSLEQRSNNATPGFPGLNGMQQGGGAAVAPKRGEPGYIQSSNSGEGDIFRKVYNEFAGVPDLNGKSQLLAAATGADRNGGLPPPLPSASMPWLHQPLHHQQQQQQQQQQAAGGGMLEVANSHPPPWMRQQQELLGQQQQLLLDHHMQLQLKLSGLEAQVRMSHNTDGGWVSSDSLVGPSSPAFAAGPTRYSYSHSSWSNSTSEHGATFHNCEAQTTDLQSRPLALPIPDDLMADLSDSLAPAIATATAAHGSVYGGDFGGGRHAGGTDYATLSALGGGSSSSLYAGVGGSSTSLYNSSMTAFDQAQHMMMFGGDSPSYQSQDRLMSMSIKLWKAHPDELPPNVKQALMTAVQNATMYECYLRQGCVHLTLDALLPRGAREPTALQVAERLLAAAGSSSDFWRSQDMQVQLANGLARVAAAGRATSVHGAPQLPVSSRVRPIAIYESTCDRMAFTVAHVAKDQLRLHVRGHGRYYPIAGAAVACGSQPDQLDVSFRLGVTAPCGLLKVEASSAQGSAETQLVLVVDEPGMAREVRELEVDSPRVPTTDLLTDLGRVLEFKWTMGRMHEEAAVEAAAAVAATAAVSGSDDEEDWELLPPQGPPVAPLRKYSAAEAREVVLTARRLAGFVCRRGWTATLASLLPVAAIGCRNAGEVARAVQQADQMQLGMLHLALCSQRPAMLHFVLNWGAAYALTWRNDPAGAAGLSPLHLAALLDDKGAAAEQLVESLEDGAHAWTNCRTADGASPADFAARSGHRHSPLRRRAPGQEILPAAARAGANQAQPSSPVLANAGSGRVVTAAAEALTLEVCAPSKKGSALGGAAKYPDCEECGLPKAYHDAKRPPLPEALYADAPTTALSWRLIVALIAAVACIGAGTAALVQYLE